MGFAAQGSGFDWSVASVFGTAVGTTLLATATLGLAYSTWQDVRASQRIAEETKVQAEAVRRSTELAERVREDQLRPIVIGIVSDFDSPGGVFLNVDVINIGGGAAVRLEVTAAYVGPLDLEFVPVLLAWLPAGGSTRVQVGVRGLPPPEKDRFAQPLPRAEAQPSAFRARGRYLDRLARPVSPPILDWMHDEFPPSE